MFLPHKLKLWPLIVLLGVIFSMGIASATIAIQDSSDEKVAASLDQTLPDRSSVDALGASMPGESSLKEEGEEAAAVERKQFKIKKFKKSYDVEEGQDFTVQCVVTGGDPKAMEQDLDYKWYRWSESYDMSFSSDTNCSTLFAGDGQTNSSTKFWLEIDGLEKKEGELEAHIRLLNTNMNTIKIEDAKYEDRRGYMCIVYNRTDASICAEGAFFVRVKEKYPAVWPFIGIVAEVVVLCIIIFVCEKRKAAAASKQAAVDEDEFNGNEVAANREINKIRQRRT